MNTIDRVYEVVKHSHIPMDPNNIAKVIDVGWGTALKYAMELVIEGKIKGIRTSKGWIFFEKQKDNGESILCHG